MKEAPVLWIWGTVATWFLRAHIRVELRPHCEMTGVNRETAYQVACQKLRKHFDAAWPQ